MKIRFSNEELMLLSLLRCGLWGKPDTTQAFVASFSWEKLVDLALQQTVLGVMTEGMGILKHESQPSLLVKQKLISYRLKIEQSNVKMNAVIPELVRILHDNGITDVWLLKGQGVGQTYPQPNARQSGDVDLLFMNMEDYRKAKNLFANYAYDKGPDFEDLEWVCVYQGITVELHAKIHHSQINRRMAKNFGHWFEEIRTTQALRRWELHSTAVSLPPYRFDALFIFIHMASHYFNSGIGLRQLCDWMMYLNAYHAQINEQQLAKDLKLLGLTKIWQIFGALLVHYLGYPASMMPLYEARYEKDAKVVLRFIFDSGNFGFHDVRTKSNSRYYYVRRFKAFVGHVQMQLRNFRMFPEESVCRLPNLIVDGLKRTKF